MTFPPDPFQPFREPNPDPPDAEMVEAAAAWSEAALPLEDAEEWRAEPLFQESLRRLELLDQAKNLRLRMEADLDRGWAAGQRQDRDGQWRYLQRAFWNLRAAHRLQMEAGEGLVPASPFAMPSLDLPFRYWGFLNAPSRCRIRVFEPKERPLVVIATELPDNSGTSITNFAAPLATQIGELLLVPLEALVWVEHYPERGPAPQERENFSLVTFTRAPHGLTAPRWRSLDRAGVAARIGGELPREESSQPGSTR